MKFCCHCKGYFLCGFQLHKSFNDFKLLSLLWPAAEGLLTLYISSRIWYFWPFLSTLPVFIMMDVNAVGYVEGLQADVIGNRTLLYHYITSFECLIIFGVPFKLDLLCKIKQDFTKKVLWCSKCLQFQSGVHSGYCCFFFIMLVIRKTWKGLTWNKEYASNTWKTQVRW